MIKNIISKLTFDDIADNTNLPVTYKDNNKYSSLIWNTYSTAKITHSNNVNVLNITSVNIRVASNTFTTDKQFRINDFELDINISFNTLNSNNNFFGITSSGSNWIYFNVRNTFIGGLSIVSSANKSMQFNYKFESNKDYNIIVSSIDNKYRLIINGETIGFIDSSIFISSLLANSNVMSVLGSGNNLTSQTDNMSNGKIWNVNISYGAGVKNEDSTHLTKYGSNLLSRLNFDNIQQATSVNIFTPSLEALVNSKVNWEYDNSKLTDYYVNTTFKTNISTDFTLLLKMSNNRKNIDTKLIEYGNYKVIYNYIGVPEPEVIVTDKTTSALDFENGIIDAISTTVWQKEGTADVTNTNKIYGNSSFETKGLGDSLYTNSNVITGGSTPFTIDFYLLLTPENINVLYNIPIFSTTVANTDYKALSRSLTSEKIFTSGNTNNSSDAVVQSNSKVKYNEINKITMSYDGSAFRVFINDILEIIKGTSNGFFIKGEFPYYFLKEFNGYTRSSYGLLDNINIFNGEARVVRDHDPYEEFLVVDLAFDGENNSTKIVDNGSLKSNWLVNGNAKISTDQKFDGFSSLYLQNTTDYIAANTNTFNFGKSDFTLSFNIIRLSDIKFDVILTHDKDANESSYDNLSLLAIYPSTDSTYPNKLYLLGQKNINGERIRYISNNGLSTNINYKIDLIVKDETLYFYINNKLDSTHILVNNIDFSRNSIVYLGYSSWDIPSSFNGYIKNFKIYKGVAVIPESPVGKIQLDFDNNVNDKYGNSTWTNNGVTFDQVNSVKGHSASFNSTYLINSNTNSMDFKNLNFSLEFDSMKKNMPTSGVYMFSSNIAYDDPSLEGVWLYKGSSTNNFSYIDYKNKPANITSNINNDYPDVWYNETISRTGGVLLQSKNDVITLTHNLTNQVFNLSKNGFILGKSQWTPANFIGYIDNFKSSKENLSKTNYKPAVHLPLETNAINIGFSSLTINSVGSPTYTVVDGKKCIKFESEKYLTINANNIFNLGNNSDFYIEFDFYPTKDNYHVMLSNGTTVTSNNTLVALSLGNKTTVDSNSNLKPYCVYVYCLNKGIIFTDNSYYLNAWNNIKYYRKGNVLSIVLNSVLTSVVVSDPLDYSFMNTYIARQTYGNTAHFEGYMSNFKMFVGTSEIPETYNDKKVLDLDFKPTRKSYLFKDNNNKCIIHTVNITQRDYQDSQYCCSFNGTNQYLQLGKNDLFNFGNDDFVINIKFKFQKRSNNLPILSGGETSNVAGYWYLQVRSETSATNPLKVEFTYRIDSSNVYTIMHNIELVENVIYDLILIRAGSTMTLSVNGIIDFSVTGVPSSFNLNTKDNTCVGINKYNPIDWIFKGKVYSLKVLRNTTDLSLLEDELDAFNESFKLTNGDETLDQVITNDKKAESHDVKFIKDEESTKLIVDGEFVEVPNVVNTIDDLILFDNYNGKVSDIKLYDKSFIDEDIFLGNDPIDTEFGEVEYADDEMELFLPEGEFNLIGFIEGYTDRKFSIYNTFYKYELYAGIEDYNITGLDEYSLDDYEINDLVSGEKYKVLTHEMIKGFISGTVNLKNCGVTSNNMEVFCYRSDNYRHIGTYSVDKDGKYVIPNLDVNSRYDIIFRDKTKKIKDQISNYRKPMKY